MEDQDYATTYEVEGHNWWFVGTRAICLDLLDRGLAQRTPERRPRILDVGCGTGITIDDLADRGDVVGLDFSPIALEFCRQRGASRLVQGDATTLPVGDRTVDAMTAIGVIEHLDEDRAALADWYRALVPGGALVLLTSSYQWMWSGHDTSNHHRRRYTAGELERLLLAEGFRVHKISYVNTVLFPPIAAVRIAERIARRGAEPAPHKDTGEVPEPVNRALLGVMQVERRAIARTRLPFGVSMVALATRA